MSANKVLLRPPAEILRVCDALDEVIGCFLLQRQKLSMGRYESEVEAMLMFNLGSRHVEGVVTLARHDLVLAPAAYHLARAALESCARAAWLVNDSNPMQREVRWLQHLDGEIQALDRLSKHRDQFAPSDDASGERLKALTTFRDRVAEALKRNGMAPRGNPPNFKQILTSLEGDNLYARYIMASQYAHAGHAATWIYRRSGVGTNKELGEYVGAEHWIAPLRLCWLALSTPGDIILSRIKGAPAAFSLDLKPSVDQTFSELAVRCIENQGSSK